MDEPDTIHLFIFTWGRPLGLLPSFRFPVCQARSWGPSWVRCWQACVEWQAPDRGTAGHRGAASALTGDATCPPKGSGAGFHPQKHCRGSQCLHFAPGVGIFQTFLYISAKGPTWAILKPLLWLPCTLVFFLFKITFILQLQCTHIIILVSGVHPSG